MNIGDKAQKEEKGSTEEGWKRALPVLFVILFLFIFMLPMGILLAGIYSAVLLANLAEKLLSKR